MGIFYPEEFTSPRPLHQRQGFLLTGRALEALAFGRVAYHDGNGFRLADPLTGLFSGVSVRVSTNAGETAEILPAGPVESEDWSATTGSAALAIGHSYFLQNDGKLSIAPPPVGAIIRVGRAISDIVLHVSFDLKVL